MPTRWGNLPNDCTKFGEILERKRMGHLNVTSWNGLSSRVTLIVNMFTKVDKFKNWNDPQKQWLTKGKPSKQSKLRPQNYVQTRLEKVLGLPERTACSLPHVSWCRTRAVSFRPRHVTAKTCAEERELRAPKVSPRPKMSRHVNARFVGGLRTHQTLVFIVVVFFCFFSC